MQPLKVRFLRQLGPKHHGTWPGQPMTAHWGIADPAAVDGTREEQSRAFLRTLTELDARTRLFSLLPFESLSAMSLQNGIREIGEIE